MISPPPVAALCCHSNHLYLLHEGADQEVSLPVNQLSRLSECIPSGGVLLVFGAEKQFEELPGLPESPIIDLEVETRRLNNGAVSLVRMPWQTKPALSQAASIKGVLDGMIVHGKQLLEHVGYQQAIQRGQTVLDHLKVSRQGLPLNPIKLAAFQHNRKRQFSYLCHELGLVDVFKFGQINPRNLKAYLAKNHGQNWPKNDQGDFRINKDTLSYMARILGGQVEQIYMLYKLSRLLEVEITTDGKGHHSIWQQPFGTKTGRCRAKGISILGLPKVMRKALMACDDSYLVEVDVCSQDVAVAAGLSEDPQMIATYESRDFYLATAEFAGEALNEANQSRLRSTYKLITLAVFYGMSPNTLACKLGCSFSRAEELISSYKALFPVFEDWVSANIFYAYRDGLVSIASGWQMQVNEATKDRTLMNWPIQAAGADLMNLALRKALSRNLKVGAVNHDALYISADTREEASYVAEMLAQCIQDAAEENIPAIQVKTSTTLLGPEQASSYPSSLRELLTPFQMR